MLNQTVGKVREAQALRGLPLQLFRGENRPDVGLFDDCPMAARNRRTGDAVFPQESSHPQRGPHGTGYEG